MSMPAKIDRVREIGFKLANQWFVNEAFASTFVLRHQGEVSRSTPPDFSKEEVIVEAWTQIKNRYLSIPDDCVSPGDLVNYLKDYQINEKS